MRIEKFINEANKMSYRIRWESQPIETSKSLQNFYKSGKFCDMMLRCHTQTIKVHKCILAAHSTYFQERFEKEKELKDITVLGITYTILKALIDYIYYGDISFPEENTKDFLDSARFFGITGLRGFLPQTISGLYETVSGGKVVNKQPLFILAKPPAMTVPTLLPCTLVSAQMTRPATQQDIQTQKTIRKKSVTAKRNQKIKIPKRESNIAPKQTNIDQAQTDTAINKWLQPPQYQTSSSVTLAQDELIDNYIIGAPISVPFKMNTLLPTLQTVEKKIKSKSQSKFKQDALNTKLFGLPVQPINFKNNPEMTFAEIMEEALKNDIILDGKPDEQTNVIPKKEFAPITFVQKKIPINYSHIVPNSASAVQKEEFIINKKRKNARSSTFPKTYKNRRSNKKSGKVAKAKKPKITIIRDEIIRPSNDNVFVERTENVLTERNQNILTERNEDVSTERNQNILTERNPNVLVERIENVSVENNDNVLVDIIDNATSEVVYPAYKETFKYVFGESPSL